MARDSESSHGVVAMGFWVRRERERESTDITREKRNNETGKVCWNY